MKEKQSVGEEQGGEGSNSPELSGAHGPAEFNHHQKDGEVSMLERVTDYLDYVSFSDDKKLDRFLKGKEVIFNIILLLLLSFQKICR